MTAPMTGRNSVPTWVMAKGHTRWRGKSVEVLVYVGDGRYKSRSVQWQGTKKATQQAADRLLRKLLDEQEAAGGSSHDKTFTQLVTRWRRHAEADWSPTTRAAYDSYLRLHILPALGSKKLHEIRPADLDDFYATLRTNIACTYKPTKPGPCATCGLAERAPVHRPLSAASIGKVHVILRRAFAEAVRWRWVTSNPAADARPPRVTRAELAPPSPAQVRKLLDLASADLYCFLTLAADTGARRGELCALRWSNVDLDAGELVIDRAVVLDDGKVVEKDTKTHQARRLALGAPAVAALKEHRARLLERAIALRVRPGPDAYLFSNDPAGREPWRPDGATRRFAALRRKAGLPNVRLHDLRHALVSDWLAAGVDPRTVMGRVGHASLQTLTRYAHFVPSADREAAQRLGERHVQAEG